MRNHFKIILEMDQILLYPSHENHCFCTVPPETEQMQDVNLKPHNTLVIPCIAKGNPVPYVSWKKVGMDQPFRTGEHKVRYTGENGK